MRSLPPIKNCWLSQLTTIKALCSLKKIISQLTVNQVNMSNHLCDYYTCEKILPFHRKLCLAHEEKRILDHQAYHR